MARNRGKLLKAQSHRGLIKMLSAIEALEWLELLDRERLRHRADTRLSMFAPAFSSTSPNLLNSTELAELSPQDARLLAWEKRQVAEDRRTKHGEN
ncbi:MAG: hypothetical protein ABI383_11055 [Acidobacteriaceae bacterium]